MIKGFESLNDREFNILKDAISQITVLIAGADGDIDQKETEWATKLTQIRSYNNPLHLNSFYEAVGVDFADKLSQLIESAPKDVKERTALLTRKLTEVNSVLSCLDNKLGAEMYNSYVSFAKHVAKASGGFLGMMSVSKEEAKLIDLSMIDPIVWEDEEE